MQTDILASILNELNSSSTDIEASAVISVDGLTMASAISASFNEDKIGAMSAAILSLGNKTAQELIIGKLEQILIMGANGYLVMVYAGNEALLTVLVKPDAKLNLIFLEVKCSADRVQEYLYGALCQQTVCPATPPKPRLSHKNLPCLNIDSRAETESAKLSKAA
jgi:predicted regulator of Ras-like GTPase activity (Roadblock/LC7/MglB family)